MANCYEKGAKVIKAQKDFERILNRSKEFWDKEFLRGEQFIILNALCEMVESIRGINDFEAASLAYKYTIPKIENFILYLRCGISGLELYKHKERGEYILKEKKKYVNKEEYTKIKVADISPPYEMKRWSDEADKFTVVDNGNGSKTELGRFSYLYTYLYERQMAIAAKYFVHYNIRYLELDKHKKAYPKREKILEAAVWWSNQMLLKKFGLQMPDSDFDIAPSVIIFSTFPSSGKSFLNNTLNEMFSNLSREITGRGGVLRISNEQGNIERQSRMTQDLISNPLSLNIYPSLRQYVNAKGKFEPFQKKTLEEWGLNDCLYAPNTSIFKTRDSAINSIRCEFGIFDDPSRGMQECDNVDIHQSITLKYNTDFMDRFDDPKEIMIMLTGTMFNPFDVFSTEIQRVFEAGGVIRDNRFRSNVYISGDRKTVIILNDVQNEDGSSAFPEYISDIDVAKKRNTIPSYEYHCIWRQKPIPAEGLIFSKEYLTFYDKLPENLSEYSFGAIDPTRKKAGDFFAMPIFKLCFDDGKYYLVDIIFEKKSTIDLYPKIVDKIISQKIIKLIYEENIDKSMGIALKDKLNAENFPYCEFIAEYSKANKQSRIVHMADTIKQWIVFPSSKFVKSTTPLGLAVNQLMEYDGEKSKHDDFPDALAMFANRQIINADKKNKITSNNKIPW